ncbi:hypothetical protein DFH07DRAFT_780561 [Mycena maculata]|uniref:Uncharacterized protein n=1 Tax=Mycena maculata TaxID=230809 RepID=A0AAD7I3P3_9AGAR|nr:hypothetical protein DFH07DRAFT_780561 [Mycena maculata]
MFYRRGLPNWAEYKCAGAPSKSEFAHQCFIDEVFLIGPSTNDVLLTCIEGVVAPSKDERLRQCLCRELFQIRTKTNAPAMRGMASPHTDVLRRDFLVPRSHLHDCTKVPESACPRLRHLDGRSLQKHSKIIRLGCWLWPVAAGEICPGGNAVTHNVQTGVGLRPEKNYPIPILLIMGRAGDKYCAKDGRKSVREIKNNGTSYEYDAGETVLSDDENVRASTPLFSRATQCSSRQVLLTYFEPVTANGLISDNFGIAHAECKPEDQSQWIFAKVEEKFIQKWGENSGVKADNFVKSAFCLTIEG